MFTTQSLLRPQCECDIWRTWALILQRVIFVYKVVTCSLSLDTTRRTWLLSWGIMCSLDCGLQMSKQLVMQNRYWWLVQNNSNCYSHFNIESADESMEDELHMGKGLLIGLCFSLFAVGLVLGGLLAYWLISQFHRRKLEPSKFSFLVKPFH